MFWENHVGKISGHVDDVGEWRIWCKTNCDAKGPGHNFITTENTWTSLTPAVPSPSVKNPGFTVHWVCKYFWFYPGYDIFSPVAVRKRTKASNFCRLPFDANGHTKSSAKFGCPLLLLVETCDVLFLCVMFFQNHCNLPNSTCMFADLQRDVSA